MQLHSPERPTLRPDVPVILVDGSPVPHLMVWPLSEATVRITVPLRNYSTGASYAYSQHHVEIAAFDLASFLAAYHDDPEATFEHYFGWTPKKHFGTNEDRPARQVPILRGPPPAAVQEAMDLL